MRFGNTLQQVVGKAITPALHHTSLELTSYGLGEPRVGINNQEPDFTMAPLFELIDEPCAEGLVLAIVHLEAEHLSSHVPIHP